MLLEGIFACILLITPNAAQLNYDLNPKEIFSEEFLRVISLHPDLTQLLDHQIPADVTKEIFFKLDKEILESCGHEYPDELANMIAEAAGAKEYLTLDIYFRAVAQALYDIYVAFGLQVEPSLAQNYVDSLIDALKSIDVNDNELLLTALLDVFVNITVAYGIDFCENIDFMARMFVQNLIDLNN